jgi:hypothetical protein
MSSAQPATALEPAAAPPRLCGRRRFSPAPISRCGSPSACSPTSCNGGSTRSRSLDEKLAPPGRRIAQAAGLASIALGGWMLYARRLA